MASPNNEDILEDLNLSSDEVKLLEDAFKKEEFRKMFFEYFEEVNDPANRKIYEEEITTIEKDRGYNVTFVHPEAGYVMKLNIAGKKAFVNICKNNHVSEATCGKSYDENNQSGYAWSIPYMLSKPREDLDKSGKVCIIFDVMFHPDTLNMAEKNPRFRKLLEDTALNGVEENFNVNFEKLVKYPKLKYKGRPPSTILRRSADPNSLHKPDELDPRESFYESLSIPQPNMPQSDANCLNAKRDGMEMKYSKTETPNSEFLVPKYFIKYRDYVDMQDYSLLGNNLRKNLPKEVIVDVDLPLVNSADNLQLDIFEKKINLATVESDNVYKLELHLPYCVDEANGCAKFDKNKKVLTITLPVLYQKSAESINSFDNSDFDCCDENNSSDTVSRHDAHSKEETFEQQYKTFEQLQTINNSVISRECMKNENSGSENCNGISFVDSNSGQNTTDHHTCTFQISRYSKLDYFMPEFDNKQTSDMIAFIFHIKNIDPKSINLTFCKCNSSCQITFYSIGAGFVPFHYSFCVKFDQSNRFSADLPDVNVSEHNVVLHLQKSKDCCFVWKHFLAGTTLNKLQIYNFLCLDNILQDFEILKNEAGAFMAQSKSLCGEQVTVSEVSSDNVTFEIQLDDGFKNFGESELKPVDNHHYNVSDTSKQNQTKENDRIKTDNESTTEADISVAAMDCPDKTSDVKTLSTDKHEVHMDPVSLEVIDDVLSRNEVSITRDSSKYGSSPIDVPSKRRMYLPHLATISPTDMSLEAPSSPGSEEVMHRRRGILKHPHYNRTISESSDDLCFSPIETSSADTSGSFSESQEDKPKKSVRFSEHVSRTIYRANSSILGQRKKNQRKARNKKKVNEQTGGICDSGEGETQDTGDSGEGSQSEPETSEFSDLEQGSSSSLDSSDDLSRSIMNRRICEQEEIIAEENFEVSEKDKEEKATEGLKQKGKQKGKRGRRKGQDGQNEQKHKYSLSRKKKSHELQQKYNYAEAIKDGMAFGHDSQPDAENLNISADLVECKDISKLADSPQFSEMQLGHYIGDYSSMQESKNIKKHCCTEDTESKAEHLPNTLSDPYNNNEKTGEFLPEIVGTCEMSFSPNAQPVYKDMSEATSNDKQVSDSEFTQNCIKCESENSQGKAVQNGKITKNSKTSDNEIKSTSCDYSGNKRLAQYTDFCIQEGEFSNTAQKSEDQVDTSKMSTDTKQDCTRQVNSECQMESEICCKDISTDQSAQNIKREVSNDPLDGTEHKHDEPEQFPHYVDLFIHKDEMHAVKTTENCNEQQVDTLLTWKEGVNDLQHRTKCEVTFSNNLMFQLD